ncbi:MAG: rRNA maturation RNase YbeY [Pseudomonadota bacterium]
MKITAELIKSHAPWKKHKDINLRLVKSVLAQTLKHFPKYKDTQEIEIAILLTDNSYMQSLNLEFRDKNKPTNVLSFPGIAIAPKDILEFIPPKDYMYLGDIAFGYEAICSEASEGEKAFQDHFTHLLIHGILHLLGLDHMQESDAKVMQDLEVEILKSFKIVSPY